MSEKTYRFWDTYTDKIPRHLKSLANYLEKTNPKSKSITNDATVELIQNLQEHVFEDYLGHIWLKSLNIPRLEKGSIIHIPKKSIVRAQFDMVFSDLYLYSTNLNIRFIMHELEHLYSSSYKFKSLWIIWIEKIKNWIFWWWNRIVLPIDFKFKDDIENVSTWEFVNEWVTDTRALHKMNKYKQVIQEIVDNFNWKIPIDLWNDLALWYDKNNVIINSFIEILSKISEDFTFEEIHDNISKLYYTNQKQMFTDLYFRVIWIRRWYKLLNVHHAHSLRNSKQREIVNEAINFLKNLDINSLNDFNLEDVRSFLKKI